MERFYTAAVIWFILGLVFFLLEFVVPGLILFFFAVGAWVTGITSLIVPLSINIQLSLFLTASILTIVLFRRALKKSAFMTGKYGMALEDEFIGKTGKAEAAFGPGERGKIYFKGTSWEAVSNDFIEQGETVLIVGNESIVLTVKSTKKNL